MELWWNGQLFRTVNPSLDYLVHTENFTLQALAGDNLLGVKGAGTSDVVGMTVDNIIFYKMIRGNQEDINGECCDLSQFYFLDNSTQKCSLCNNS